MDRRHMLRGTGLAVLGTGFLARLDRVAAQQPATSLTDAVRRQATGKSEELFLKGQPEDEGPPAPATYDRLPLDWNRRTVERWKNRLAAREIQAFLVRDPLNIIYLTGYWHTTTERPQAVFMNQDDRDPWFLYPGLDRDIVTSWWFGGGRMYFDIQHGEDAFPHQGRVLQGKKVDLFRFLLEGVKEHGVQGSRIAIDGELYPSEIEKAKDVLGDVHFSTSRTTCSRCVRSRRPRSSRCGAGRTCTSTAPTGSRATTS